MGGTGSASCSQGHTDNLTGVVRFAGLGACVAGGTSSGISQGQTALLPPVSTVVSKRAALGFGVSL